MDYCKDLERAYKIKHEEVRALTDYLKELVSKTPNTPISETDVVKIIDSIGNIKIPDNVEERQKRLDILIKDQQAWKNEIRILKPKIDTKLNTLLNPVITEEIIKQPLNF